MKNSGWGGSRKGSGRKPLQEIEKKKVIQIYVTDKVKEDILHYGSGKTLSEKTTDLINSEISNRKNSK